ncbi:hypothetical protein CCACVL1_24377 [Corchorus capsularis]|uniref:Uncharacterized protein n=1 Tax=Corchorus capsularis TaxID=210143 RepID=A0A1R3GPW7_COCAP|nr:hypothetical protein CCACVL1_24377 [Corchorus capsularis]
MAASCVYIIVVLTLYCLIFINSSSNWTLSNFFRSICTAFFTSYQSRTTSTNRAGSSNPSEPIAGSTTPMEFPQKTDPIDNQNSRLTLQLQFST